MLKAVVVSALAVTFSGAASAQSYQTQPQTAPDRGTVISPYRHPPQPRPHSGESAAGTAHRYGRVDLNTSGTLRGGTGRSQGYGTVPQRLGPISPGTGAHDSGVPDSSTYNPSTPAIR